MGGIIRQPRATSKETYDLIIIGGGIYGAMLSLESSLRGLRSLLLERDDFGEYTSFNSLRVIHGGLRYLQSFDLHRFRESISERRWFLQTFPYLVKPLPCLMPLYGEGLRRPFILRIALWGNNLLSIKRNRGVSPDHYLPSGKVIDATQTKEFFSHVDPQGLQGGAVWYDAIMPDSQRLLIDILRWSCECGATALNYVEANRLLQNKKNVSGVEAIDRESGSSHEYKAKVVVNAAGPWCRKLARHFDRDKPSLFQSSIGWNVLLNRKALSDHAVAVVPKKPGAQTYFLIPWKGMLMAGTGQAPWFGGHENPMPSNELLDEFLGNLNLAVPKLEASQDEIIRVFAGLLPATEFGSATFANREVIFDHQARGGPRGFYSISGVKFTTARLVAEKTLNQIFPERKKEKDVITGNFRPLSDGQDKRGIFDFDCNRSGFEASWKDSLKMLIKEESVHHLDDLTLRRTNLWENPSRSLEVATLLCELFDWDDYRCRGELKRLVEKLGNGRLIGSNATSSIMKEKTLYKEIIKT